MLNSVSEKPAPPVPPQMGFAATVQRPMGFVRLLLVLAAVAALVLCVVGCVVDVYTLDVTDATNQITVTVDQSLWWADVCVNGACESDGLPLGRHCSSMADRLRTLQAFAIVSAVVALFAVVSTVLELLHLTRIPAGALTSMVLWLLLLILWAVTAGTYHAALCGHASMKNRGLKMSASFALWLCLWIVETVFILAYAVAAMLQPASVLAE